MYEAFSLVAPLDLLGVIIYLIIAYIILYRWKSKQNNNNLSKYIIPTFSLRIFSSFCLYYIAQFVYKSGDVFFYVKNIKIYNSIFRKDPTLIPEILFNDFKDLAPGVKNLFEISFESYASPTVLICKIGSILGLFTNDNFLCISITFSILSAIGVWKLYLVFTDLYPHLYKKLAYGVLFLPSVFFWGSGLAKDPLCIFGLGFLVYYFYEIMFKKRFSIKNVMFLFFGVYILLIIKPYILFSFAPSLLIWLFFQYNYKVSSTFLRRLNIFIISIILPLGIFYYLQSISSSENSDVSKFATENLFEEIKNQQDAYIGINNYESNSFVSIGEFDQSFAGLIKSFPLAINLTLFRPYIWEVRNPFMLISALESLFFLLFFLFVFFKIGVLKFFKTILKSPFLLACFVFVIFFAGFVGITTFNFGTIARYKIPCLPFLFVILTVLHQKQKESSKII
jgi:hypothetical protein